MLYNTLLPFADCNIVEKSTDNEIRFEIKKYWGKLKVYINYRGKSGDTIENVVQPKLEHLTSIPDLVKELKMGAVRRIEKGSPEDNYSFSCEVRGGELFK